MKLTSVLQWADVGFHELLLPAVLHLSPLSPPSLLSLLFFLFTFLCGVFIQSDKSVSNRWECNGLAHLCVPVSRVLTLVVFSNKHAFHFVPLGVFNVHRLPLEGATTRSFSLVNYYVFLIWCYWNVPFGFWCNDLHGDQRDSLRDDLLDGRVVAKSGRDAVELITADHNCSEREDVSETLRKVGQMILMQEQGDQLLQPVTTPLIKDGCCIMTLHSSKPLLLFPGKLQPL